MNHITIGEIVREDREVFPPYLYGAYQSTQRRAPALPLIDVPLTLDEPANAEDALLQCVPGDRRATLLASREPGDSGVVYRFDIVLQGADETAFFNL